MVYNKFLTKEEFIKFHLERGYTVDDKGEMVIISISNLTGIYYFTKDGKPDNCIEPFICLRH